VFESKQSTETIPLMRGGVRILRLPLASFISFTVDCLHCYLVPPFPRHDLDSDLDRKDWIPVRTFVQPLLRTVLVAMSTAVIPKPRFSRRGKVLSGYIIFKDLRTLAHRFQEKNMDIIYFVTNRSFVDSSSFALRDEQLANGDVRPISGCLN
jgi:hypothetical protein